MKELSTFLVLLCLSFCNQNVLSQNKLLLSIKDIRNRQSLAFVTINFPELQRTTSTDSSGNAIFGNLHEGNYLIEVSSVGYATVIDRITLKGDSKKEYLLVPSKASLQEVIVTGVSSATDKQRVPFSVSAMDKGDLTESTGTNIIDAITKIPGVSAITDGQSIAKPIIRGLGYNRVVTVADGITQQGQQWGDEFGIEVDQWSVDRVEVLKGPASLIYGSDAISGVVNLIREPALPEGQTKGELLTTYQTNNGLFAGMFQASGNKRGLTWNFRIDNTMAHAYRNHYDGYVLNSQFSNFNIDGGIGILRRWGFSQIHYSRFDLKTGIVDGTRDSATGILERQVALGDSVFYVVPSKQELKSYTPFLINQNVQHQKMVWETSVGIGEGRMSATFGWQRNDRRENNDATQPDVSNIYYLLNSLNYDLRYVSNLPHEFSFSTGVNGIYQNSKNMGTLQLIPEYNLLSIGAYAIANKKIHSLIISSGLRYDTRSFKGYDGYTDSSGKELSASVPDAIHKFSAYHSIFSGFSGSIGATYSFNHQLYIKTTFARGFRAANVAETGSNGIHDGTVVYEIGQPDLRPETNLEFDISPGINSPNFTAEISIFLNNINNYIYPKPLKSAFGGDSINNSTPGFGNAPVFKYTQGNARIIGGELEATLHPVNVPWFNWNITFSALSEFLKDMPDSSKYPPFIPPAKFQTALSFKLLRQNHSFTDISIKLGMYHNFPQTHLYNSSSIYMGLSSYELAASRAPAQGYSIFNIGAQGNITNHKKTTVCSWYFTLNNIFNKTYIDYMSRFKYYPANLAVNPVRVGVYNMGRNLSFKLLIPLNFTKT